MQPYIFPYIGYFQLINAVDEFIVYDNIQFTKKGWINRNRILVNGSDSIFTLPLWIKKINSAGSLCEYIVSPALNGFISKLFFFTFMDIAVFSNRRGIVHCARNFDDFFTIKFFSFVKYFVYWIA